MSSAFRSIFCDDRYANFNYVNFITEEVDASIDFHCILLINNKRLIDLTYGSDIP